MDDIPLVHDFQSQILIIQLPPVNERITERNRQTKAKNFLPLIREMDDLPLIRNFQSSCWKLFNLRQSNYRKRHFSVEK